MSAMKLPNSEDEDSLKCVTLVGTIQDLLNRIKYTTIEAMMSSDKVRLTNVIIGLKRLNKSIKNKES